MNIEDIKIQLLVSIADAGLLKLDAAEQAALNRCVSGEKLQLRHLICLNLGFVSPVASDSSSLSLSGTISTAGVTWSSIR